MKKHKHALMRDRVDSANFHVGIELELKAPCDGQGWHDDVACHESHEDYIRHDSGEEILRNHLCLSREEARSVAPYFDREQWIGDYMSDFSCDDVHCPHYSASGDSVREQLRDELKRLTGNASFKVVEDGSIETDGEITDAEVCWNYYASKDTIKDNEKILNYLRSEGCEFDESCGLHINLNNYLNVERPSQSIPTRELSFLFKLVAPSREESNYCNTRAISADHKYSMIYHQGDRLEFRFFSPTLNHEKLNAYVSVAHFVYKRLAGKNCKLPKKLKQYLIKKMVEVNDLDTEYANETIQEIESIKPIQAYQNSNSEESLAS